MGRITEEQFHGIMLDTESSKSWVTGMKSGYTIIVTTEFYVDGDEGIVAVRNDQIKDVGIYDSTGQVLMGKFNQSLIDELKRKR